VLVANPVNCKHFNSTGHIQQFKEQTMNTNFDYNRFQAQSKLQQFQQEGMLSQQLKRLEEPKTSPASTKKTRQWFQSLKLKLFRLAYS